jgi:hypothetical protein
MKKLIATVILLAFISVSIISCTSGPAPVDNPTSEKKIEKKK